MNNRKILFVAIFVALGLLALQVSIDRIVGSSQSFTLFELIGPVGGMFLGPLMGALAAFVVMALNMVIFHQSFNLMALAMLLPAMAAAAELILIMAAQAAR